MIARSAREYRSWDAGAILTSFKRQARPWVDPMGWTYWDWLVTARHHGVPTRLLDFTTNSLAALWFAVEQIGLQMMRWYMRCGIRTRISSDLPKPSGLSHSAVRPLSYIYQITSPSGLLPRRRSSCCLVRIPAGGRRDRRVFAVRSPPCYQLLFPESSHKS